MNSKTFTKKINNILTDNKIDRFVRGKKRGKLDTKSLHKIQTNLKVFKKKEERGNKEYYITLYLDLSLSMTNTVSYSKTNNVIPRMTAMGIMVDELQETLSKINGIKTRIIFYSTNCYLFKDYSQNSVSVIDKIHASNYYRLKRHYIDDLTKPQNDFERKLFKNLPNNRTQEVGYITHSENVIFGKKVKKTKPIQSYFESDMTFIGDCLAYLPPEHENEISFIFSDGDFNDKYSGNYAKYLREKISRLKGKVFGVGMMSTDIIQYLGFSKSFIIYDMEDLYKMILHKISKNIARG